MLKQKKNLFLIFFVAPFFVFGSSDRERRITELEKQMMEVGAYQKNQQFTAVYGPTYQSRYSASINVEPLFYKTHVGSSNFICFSEPTTPFSSVGSSYYSPLSFDLTPGVRVSFTKEDFYENCSLALAYTYFYTSTHLQKKKGQACSFTGFSQLQTPRVFSQGEYTVNYQNLDIDLCKGYFVSEKVLFHGAFGFKGAYLKQKENNEYEINLDHSAFLFFKSKEKQTTRFTALGPKISFLTRWYLFKEISLFNRGAASLLYGYYKIFDDYHSEEKDNLEPVNHHITVNQDFHSMSPYADLSLGVSWNKAYYKEKIMLTLSIGYDLLFFWRQAKNFNGIGVINKNIYNNESKTFFFSKKGEDISFNGLFIQTEINF